MRCKYQLSNFRKSPNIRRVKGIFIFQIRKLNCLRSLWYSNGNQDLFIPYDTILCYTPFHHKNMYTTAILLFTLHMYIFYVHTSFVRRLSTAPFSIFIFYKQLLNRKFYMNIFKYTYRYMPISNIYIYSMHLYFSVSVNV